MVCADICTRLFSNELKLKTIPKDFIKKKKDVYDESYTVSFFMKSL